MTQILYVPFSVVGGIFAGFVGKKTFQGLWRLFDDQDAPNPKDREIAWTKLMAALLLQGAIWRGVRALRDQGPPSA